MKKITLLMACILIALTHEAQNGLQAVIVEKYYQTNAADSANAANNNASTILRKGSVTYRVFIDMAPGYKFLTYFGNKVGGVVQHPLIFRTTTDFYNDPTWGQVYPQSTSTVNVKKNTAMIDSWLTVGPACFGRMGVLKTEDTDGSLGNSNGVLTNTLGGIFGAAINSVVPGARDGLMPPGSATVATPIGITTETDIFDQTPGNTFSVTSGAISALGGIVGTTTTNAILIGQFTTNGIFSFSLNIQIQNTVTGTAEVYVPNNPLGLEYVFPSLGYSSAVPTTTVDTTTNSIRNYENEIANISVYPNPIKDSFTFSASNVQESSNNVYSIYDITGRIILSRPFGRVSGKFSETVELSDFIPGLYFLNVSFDGVSTTRKIVKE
jgi:hypothetical protein